MKLFPYLCAACGLWQCTGFLPSRFAWPDEETEMCVLTCGCGLTTDLFYFLSAWVPLGLTCLFYAWVAAWSPQHVTVILLAPSVGLGSDLVKSLLGLEAVQCCLVSMAVKIAAISGQTVHMLSPGRPDAPSFPKSSAVISWLIDPTALLCMQSSLSSKARAQPCQLPRFAPKRASFLTKQPQCGW